MLHLSTPYSDKMKQDVYRNIAVIVGGLLIISLVFDFEVLVYISAVIAMASGLFPPVGRMINWLWMRLALILGWFNSRVLLSVVYFILLFPIALVSRLFTKDSLQLKPKEKKSYFEERNHTFTKEDLINTW